MIETERILNHVFIDKLTDDMLKTFFKNSCFRLNVFGTLLFAITHANNEGC
jgi:hypothetical protein